GATRPPGTQPRLTKYGGTTLTRVWLPDSPGEFSPLPPGIEADVWAGGGRPDGAGQVEYVVLPLGVRPDAVRKIATLPRLKTIQILSAGADHILPYVPAHVTLCNARGAHTAGGRPAAPRGGRGPGRRSEPVGGKHVLIVGYGDIGAAVERRLAGWEVTVERVARHARDGVHPAGELPELLRRADVVVILVPVTDETRQLVNKEFLRAMKDGALLVNAARGVIVDTDALLEALTSGRIRAALDVTDPEPLPEGHPLWRAPGLLLTPHVGGAVSDATGRSYRVVSEQLARLAAGEPL